MPADEETDLPGESTEATQVVSVPAGAKAAAPAEIIAANASTPVKPDAKPEPSKPPEASDDAIADFLLDIKLEDE